MTASSTDMVWWGVVLGTDFCLKAPPLSKKPYVCGLQPEICNSRFAASSQKTAAMSLLEAGRIIATPAPRGCVVRGKPEIPGESESVQREPSA